MWWVVPKELFSYRTFDAVTRRLTRRLLLVFLLKKNIYKAALTKPSRETSFYTPFCQLPVRIVITASNSSISFHLQDLAASSNDTLAPIADPSRIYSIEMYSHLLLDFIGP